MALFFVTFFVIVFVLFLPLIFADDFDMDREHAASNEEGDKNYSRDNPG